MKIDCILQYPYVIPWGNVRSQHLAGGETSRGETFKGRTDEGAKRP